MARWSKPIRLKALGLKLLISLVTVVMVLGFAELAFWVVGWPGDLIDVTFPPFATIALNTTEFQVEIKMNKFGLRDHEYEPTKGADTFRILVIGDSYTMGHGVLAEQSYPKLLERRLNEGTSSTLKYEVINAGLSTYGPAQYLRVMRALGPIFKPDLVLVCFFSGNDVASMEGKRPPGAVAALFRRALPRTSYVIRRAWSTANNSLRAGLKMASVDRRSLFEMRRTIWRATGAADQRVAEQVAQETNGNPEQMIDWSDSRAERGRSRPATFFFDTIFLTSETMRQLEGKAEAALAELRQEATGLGAASALIIAPASLQVDRSQWPLYAAEGMYLDDRLLNEQPLHDRLAAFGQEQQLPVLDLLPVFRARAGQALYFPLDGHWTPPAHELVADTLYQFLRTERLAP